MTAAMARLSAALADRYRIARELGQGGMATVYLAHDLKHERDVAIKVLHPDLGAALGADRFLSEIKTTARLQHPHILPLLDSGSADGLLYYVMPLVTGETLRTRLAREKQLPIDEALQLTREVADALGYAHGLGVIHRDIKPENILLQGGHALVADFGIALAVQSAGGQRMTQTGLSLGTPQYMSPEQAMGERAIDARSDIYALGVVTYEMLTGDPPFTGSTVQAIVAKVLTEKPTALTAVRDTVSPGVEAAVLRALAKLPADRFASARAFVDALGQPAPAGTIARTGARDIRPARSPRVVALLGVLAVATAVTSVGWWRAARQAPRALPVQLSIETPINTHIVDGPRAMAITSDGRTVAIAVEDADARRSLYVRSLGDVTLVQLAGTDGATDPAFSPDGASIAFVAGQQLKKVPTAGGPVVTLADVGDTQGIGWGPAGLILVSSDGRLAVVPENGGDLRRLGGSTTPPGVSERNPIPLPDGTSLLYSEWGGAVSGARVMRRTLAHAPAVPFGVDSATGIGLVGEWLVAAGAGGVLRIVPVDAAVAKVTGPSRQVMDGVAQALGLPMAAVAGNGTLLYRPGSGLADLVMMGPRGDTAVVSRERRDYQEPRFSPNGRLIAAAVVERRGNDIVVIDRTSKSSTRLTDDGKRNGRPEWSPDGTRVIYRSFRDSLMSIWWRRWDGAGAPELLQANSKVDLWEGNVSPDGAWLLYRTGTQGSADIWYRRLTGDTATRPFAATSTSEREGRFSPDGRWVAYTADQSGLAQVYVRPFPVGEGRLQVSANGGEQPVWSHDGRTLYYVSARGGIIVRARVTLQPALAVTSRDTIVRSGYYLPARNGHAMYDAAPDGEQLLLVRRVASSVPTIVAVGWLDDVRATRSREAKQ